MGALGRWWSGIFPSMRDQGTPLLVGDELADALVPLAADMVTAAHAKNRPLVGDIFAHATALAGDELVAAQLLAVLCAAMCSEDHAPNASLGWTRNPAEYRRLRSTMDALSASLHAGQQQTRAVQRGA